MTQPFNGQAEAGFTDWFLSSVQFVCCTFPYVAVHKLSQFDHYMHSAVYITNNQILFNAKQMESTQGVSPIKILFRIMSLKTILLKLLSYLPGAKELIIYRGWLWLWIQSCDPLTAIGLRFFVPAVSLNSCNYLPLYTIRENGEHNLLFFLADKGEANDLILLRFLWLWFRLVFILVISAK